MPKGIYYNRGKDKSKEMEILRANWRQDYQKRKFDLKLKRTMRKLENPEKEAIISHEQYIIRRLRELITRFKNSNVITVNNSKYVIEIKKRLENLNYTVKVKNSGRYKYKKHETNFI